MDPNDIRPVEGTLGPGGGGGGEVSPTRARSRQAPRRRRDQAQFTAPSRAILQLIRERVLDSTRRSLELPRSAAGPRFVGGDLDGVNGFVGRLVSDQNLLVSQCAGAVPPERIRAALAEGMVQGLSETLEILDELNELDRTCWELVCDVLNAFCRKSAAI